MNNDIYIAGPWFTPEQHRLVEAVKIIIDRLPFTYFSPKDTNLFEHGKTTPKEVVDVNVNAIRQCSLVIAITNGKDVGTMFECGAAHVLGVPIIYLWTDRRQGQAFNIMLAGTGDVAFSLEELEEKLIDGIKFPEYKEDELYE